jgi:parallel beta-helix repeat protein
LSSGLSSVSKSLFLGILPLALAVITHLWNPIGFPDIFYDEGTYMRRAMHLLSSLGSQEVIENRDPYYDHPYFGQIFLAAALGLIGYPHSLNLSANGDTHSIEMLYIVPRVLMGLLAVIDTFLIYKIAEHRYNKRVAFIASVLFAVMPVTWLTRRILLDSIQLPFLLLSILFAVYYNKKNTLSIISSSTYTEENEKKKENKNDKKNIPLILLSGIFLGLAIFTKIPAFTMIPLVGYLIIFTNTNKNQHNKENYDTDDYSTIKGKIIKILEIRRSTRINLKAFGLWLIPVILIPAIWPGYSLLVNEFNYWLGGVIYQTGRQGEGQTLPSTINILFQIDPVIFILSIIGLVFAAIKRDFFLLLWAIPYLTFLYMIGYVSYFHLIPLIPVLCVAGARLIHDLPNRIAKKNREISRILPLAVISILGIFGLIGTITLITTNVSGQFEAAAFVLKYLGKHNTSNDDITIVSSPVYSWIFSYVYNKEHTLSGFRDVLFRPIETYKLLLISDSHFKSDTSRSERLNRLLDNTYTIFNSKTNQMAFNKDVYPYTSMALNVEGKQPEIRVTKPNYSACITYDKSKRLISIACTSANLTEMYYNLNTPQILNKEFSKVWLLNANLVVENGATLYINSTDTSWLKINSTGKNTHYYIQARGNLIIDSVKITSWDSIKNDYTVSTAFDSFPRSYILVNAGTGMTNITNSELAYLGYDHANSFGLTYFTGAGSIIKNNKIHNLWYGFHSLRSTAHDIRIENNEFSNNVLHGIYSHDATNHILISDNKVHNNGRHGIICSAHCYDIYVKSNQVYNNGQVGIMFNNNVSNSVIANSTIYNNKIDQILIQASSHDNQIYNNKMSYGKSGITITQNSSHNQIYDNFITNSSAYGIHILKDASENVISHNTIKNAKISTLFVEDHDNIGHNVFKNNKLLVNSTQAAFKTNSGGRKT